MKDYGIDVYAQCIGGKVVFVRKPLVFKDDRKPFVKEGNPLSSVTLIPKECVRLDIPLVTERRKRSPNRLIELMGQSIGL